MSPRGVVLAALLGAAACSSPGDGEGPVSRAASPIIKGTDSPVAQDAVVLVMHYDAIKLGGDTAGCTGTMLTPRLVLTARHCVADTDETALCDENGNATTGGGIKGDNPASKLYVFSGPTRPDFISGLDKSARGVELVDDGAKTLCNHDIALILLDKPLAGAKTAPVRLDGGPSAGEKVVMVGWGMTEKNPMPAMRQQRGGLEVLGVGPAKYLGPAEFFLGESGCAGDSGGPAFDEASGAVVGVLSRGGNTSGAAPGTVEGCIDAQNVLTSTASYKDLITSAYQKAGQDPWAEGQPDPTTLPPKPPDDGKSGCAIACPASHEDTGALAAGAIAAVVACVRRRRSRSCAA